MSGLIGSQTYEPSPEHNMEGRNGLESPKKLKLTLKGDKYIQKIQKSREDASDY